MIRRFTRKTFVPPNMGRFHSTHGLEKSRKENGTEEARTSFLRAWIARPGPFLQPRTSAASGAGTPASPCPPRSPSSLPTPPPLRPSAAVAARSKSPRRRFHRHWERSRTAPPSSPLRDPSADAAPTRGENSAETWWGIARSLSTALMIILAIFH
jgi:hypothetical protein